MLCWVPMLTHADNGTLVVHDNTLSLQRVSALANNLGDLLIEWVGEANVPDNATLEEGERSDALGSVDNLVWDDEVAWLDLLLEGADCGEGDDTTDTNRAESGNVGAVWNFMWCNGMICSVAGKKSNDGVLVLEDGDWGGWNTPWSVDVQAGNWGEAIELLESGATNNSNVDWA